MGFIASDPQMITALLEMSGLQPGDLRQAAAKPEFGLFLLDFILQEDSRVLAFAADQSLRPEAVLQAREWLAHLEGETDALKFFLPAGFFLPARRPAGRGASAVFSFDFLTDRG